MSNRWRLKADELNMECASSMFNFTSTEELQPLNKVVGQERACQAFQFALGIDADGYNIYLAGESGTGRTTMARNMLAEKAKLNPVPDDWCYVYNFAESDKPNAIKLPPGEGKIFKADIKKTIEDVTENIFKVFQSDEFENQKNIILNAFIEETNKMYLQLEQETLEYGYTITRTASGINSVALVNGEPLSQEAYLNMSEDEKADLLKKGTIVQEKINDSYRKYKELERISKEQVKEAENNTARDVAAPYFKLLQNKYNNNDKILKYLNDILNAIIENLADFTITDGEMLSPGNFLQIMGKRDSLKRYQVNLLVDHSDQETAPVVFCTNPTYTNLFGQIEYESEFGVLGTDFTKIKPGALHKANGGFLVLNAVDVLKNYYVWDTLKRALKDKEILVENLSNSLGLISTEAVQPEPIPLALKIILIGEPIYYHLLYTHDEDFHKLFKIKADFDVEMPRTQQHMEDYADFVSSLCHDNHLLHFTPDAVARLVEYGSRLVDDKNKLTTRFNKLAEIIYEANFWAQNADKQLVTRTELQKAINEKHYRAAVIEEKMQEYILRDSIIINVTDCKIGEINGLAVYDMGDYSFAKPVRITAKTFMGEKGIVNIERETSMSGNIHSKGVLTLNGYLGHQYAQDKPLSISASLTIEQSYSGIEGDSASSAELYALISSLAEVPIKQGIAVTGSVNQNGEIQPIGGVNEKISGFYQVCKQKGCLTGEQGVIIPRRNRDQLILDEEIITAVANHEFNIWAIENVDQGLEILTGIKAGEKSTNGYYPKDTIHDRANQKIKSWNEKSSPIVTTTTSSLFSQTRGRRQRR